jgi:hypothetical protein
VNNVTTASTTSLAYTVPGLTPSTSYTFTVKAKDAAGNTSPASNAVVVATSAASAPFRVEAENFISMKGISTEPCSDAGGGLNVTSIDSRDYMDYAINIPVAGSYRIDFRVASTVTTGKLEFRKNQTILATVLIPNTGGVQTWQTVSSNVTLAAGTQTFRVFAKNGTFKLNYMDFAAGASLMIASVGEREVLSENGEISTYPNPASNYLTIKTEDGEKIIDVEIVNAQGEFRKLRVESSSIQISTVDWPKGLNLLRVHTARSFSVKKIMIE